MLRIGICDDVYDARLVLRAALERGDESIPAVLIQNGLERNVTLTLPGITKEEREIILAGCLINYYAK